MDPRLLMAQSARLIARYQLIYNDPAPLARVLNRCSIRRLEADEVLCREGAEGDALYFLLAGRIAVQKLDPLGGEHELARLEAPSMFGHMSLIDGSRRSATCQAAEPSVIALLGVSSYQRLLADPGEAGCTFRQLLLAGMIQQLNAANTRIREMIERGEEDMDDRMLTETSGILQGWSR